VGEGRALPTRPCCRPASRRHEEVVNEGHMDEDTQPPEEPEVGRGGLCAWALRVVGWGGGGLFGGAHG